MNTKNCPYNSTDEIKASTDPAVLDKLTRMAARELAREVRHEPGGQAVIRQLRAEFGTDKLLRTIFPPKPNTQGR